jgi:dihydroorotate dehydrogenase electron transfer subunit
MAHNTSLARFEVEAPVVAHECVIGAEFEIVLSAPEVASVAQPGQFVELLFGENFSPLIRRPFSLFRVDREAGTFSILYVARGSFTSGLKRKQVGDRVSLLGPLGNPFQVVSALPALLIAGGIGAPPLLFLAREICGSASQSSLHVINAARNRDLLVGMGEFAALGVGLTAVTEDGSYGVQGRATDLLRARLEAGERWAIYSCGPMPMLRAIGEIAQEYDLPCQLSVETAMPCGIGFCFGCAIPVLDTVEPGGFRYARACVEGPVFEARTLLWKG